MTTMELPLESKPAVERPTHRPQLFSTHASGHDRTPLGRAPKLRARNPRERASEGCYRQERSQTLKHPYEGRSDVRQH